VKERSSMVIYDLTKAEDLDLYLSKSASLNQKLPNAGVIHFDQLDINKWEKFSLRISPKDFFIFGAGFGDEDADRISKKEKYIRWVDGKPQLLENEFILIPATSVKGALWHRVSFHFNKESGNITGELQNSKSPQKKFDYASLLEQIEELKNNKKITINSEDDVYESLIQEIENFSIVGCKDWQDYIKYLEDEGVKINRTSSVNSDENKAVNELFGYAKDSEREIAGKRGSVLLSDIYLPYSNNNEKVFNHVKIDRFTGGTLDGALFQEKAFHHTEVFDLDIWVEISVLKDAKIKKAFEQSLTDLESGNLPLGGMTTKGHGFFKGEKLDKK